jgi:hypothetical protein
VFAPARRRKLVVIHATMPGAKLGMIERKVLIQLGRREELEFAFGTLHDVHVEPMLTASSVPHGFRGRELEWWLKVV